MTPIIDGLGTAGCPTMALRAFQIHLHRPVVDPAAI